MIFELPEGSRSLSSNERRKVARDVLRPVFEPVRQDHLRIIWLNDGSKLGGSRRTRFPRYRRCRTLGELCIEIANDAERLPRSVITDWLFTDGVIALQTPDQPSASEVDMPRNTTLIEVVESAEDWGGIVERQEGTAARRPDQIQFRERVKRAAKGRCEISGALEDCILEAAHIIVFGDRHDDNSVENGLYLTRNLHALFDDGHLWLEPVGNRHRVRFTSDIRCEEARLDGQLIEMRTCFVGRELRSIKR